MKFISVFFLFCMSITLISCGDKDESPQGSGTVSSSLSTEDGFYSEGNPTAPVEALGVSYAISDQQSMILLNQALADAQVKNVKPLKVNGVTKYRVRMKGEVIQLTNKEDLSYPEYNPHQGRAVLKLSSAEFY